MFGRKVELTYDLFFGVNGFKYLSRHKIDMLKANEGIIGLVERNNQKINKLEKRIAQLEDEINSREIKGNVLGFCVDAAGNIYPNENNHYKKGIIQKLGDNSALLREVIDYVYREEK